MTSEVQIAKMALSHLGDKWEISSLTEASVEARQCNLHYATARDAVLRDLAPGWATRYEDAGELSDSAVGNWTYEYAYPADCLRVIHIVNPIGDNEDPIPFEIAISADGDRRILTDQEDAEIKIVAQVTNTVIFDPLFVRAMALRLAADICIPLTRDVQLHLSLEQAYDRLIRRVAMHTANEGPRTVRNEGAQWVRDR